MKGPRTDRFLLMVRTDVEGEWEERFNRWYTGEHVPTLMKVPGFRWGRRYRVVEGDPTEPAPPGLQRYLAIYGLDSPEVLRSPEYEAVRAWDSGLQPHLRNTVVALYELLSAEVGEG
jgi:hypothetical protein